MKLLIIGCGELGSRFLQAAAQVREINQIDVVELSNRAKKTAQSRWIEVQKEGIEKIELVWHHSFNSSIPVSDLCIIATQSDTRLEVFERVISHGIKKIISEKIVTQSEASYLKIINLSEKNGVNIWVNCKTRAVQIWNEVKNKIDIQDHLVFHSTGGDHGLCTNGLHTLDLFAFLTESSELINDGSHLDYVLHKTKREKFDLSGVLSATGRNNSKCVISYSQFHRSMPFEVLSTSNYRWIIDPASQVAYEGERENGWKMKALYFSENMSVSHMSIDFIRECLLSNSSRLPNLQQTFAAHKFLYDVTLPIFNQLLNKDDDKCPIT